MIQDTNLSGAYVSTERRRCIEMQSSVRGPSKLLESSLSHYHWKGLLNTLFLAFTLSGCNGPQLKQVGRRFCPLAVQVF